MWMILFHQKLDAKISLVLFGLLNFNSFIILNQALPTLFHKVDLATLLWSTYKHHFKLGLHPTSPLCGWYCFNWNLRSSYKLEFLESKTCTTHLDKSVWVASIGSTKFKLPSFFF
jgi:hypothetical protein